MAHNNFTSELHTLSRSGFDAKQPTVAVLYEKTQLGIQSEAQNGTSKAPVKTVLLS